MSSFKAYSSLKKVKYIKSQQFVVLRRSLLESLAWQSLSIYARKVLDVLIIENMAHAGLENGFLCVSYNQLEKTVKDRHYITKAIKELEKKGLIRRTIYEKIVKFNKYAYNYRLTFLPQKVISGNQVYYIEPTDEWKLYKQLFTYKVSQP